VVAPFVIAFGDAPSKTLPAAATVAIAPADDSVDTNRIIITGSGTINSFGIAYGGQTRAQYLNDPDDVAATDDVITVTKRVEFRPDAGQVITLHHDPLNVSLLGGADRVIKTKSFGEYQSDTTGYWCEISFAQGDLLPNGDGGLIAINSYTASATITIPPNCTKAWVRMWGGSGAAGSGNQGLYASSGVGAPGYLEKYLSNLAAGKTLTFTFGAAGVAVANGDGGNGAASVLASGTQTIGTLTANGSNGTPIGTPAAGGTVGGTATGGDINRQGQTGAATSWTLAGIQSPGTYGSTNPGIGGTTALSRGPDGCAPANTTGANGFPGGMIIAWFR
jgi:hypothetical protein